MDNKLPSVKEMIKDACENTELDFDTLWCGESSQSFSLSAVMTEDQIRQADIHPVTKQAGKAQWELMSIIFQKYMDSYPANAVFKQKLYEDLMNCLQYVLDVYALVASDKLKTALEAPVKEDPTATFLKVLHNQSGLTADEIAEQLHKSREAVLNDFKRLNEKKLRYAGQVVTAEIKRDDANQPYRYHTPNTIHPLSMLLNVSQAGELMKSLYCSYAEQGRGICRGIALNIWLQLSDYGRVRIEQVFGANDMGFRAFLRELQEDAEDGIRMAGYLSEAEMIQDNSPWDISEGQRFSVAVKGGLHCKIQLGGSNEWIDSEEIQMLGPTSFRVIKHDKEQKSLLFSADDVLRFVPIED